MNIIALSLGLTPVPPRPAAAVGRLHYTPHDLAAFLTITQVAADLCKARQIVAHGSDAASVLLAMRDRVEAGKSWNVTIDERERLMRAIVAIDRWFPMVRWQQALRKAYRLADEALERGAKPLELMVEAA